MIPSINIQGHVCSPRGFRAATASVGIRRGHDTRDDLALIVSDVRAAAAAVYTKNAVQAAPVQISKMHSATGKAQAVIANSGNANCATPTAHEVALGMCRQTAHHLALPVDDVLVASTGVIGQTLSLTPIAQALPALTERLDAAHGPAVARAIMTTDTEAKSASVSLEIDGATVTIGAAAKGSGMIAPNMGTMLCFLTTDANISAAMLQEALSAATARTFNMVSVDGDTSTNDTVFLLANALAGHPLIQEKNAHYDAFYTALETLCRHLARLIAGAGEGAHHLITVEVKGAADEKDAQTIAKAIAASPLVKTAVHGEDANWGRILAAAGYSGIPFDPTQTTIRLSSDQGTVQVSEHGMGLDFDEALAAQIMSAFEVIIQLNLAEGNGAAIAYGCDLSCDYVHINADYRS